MEFTRPTNENFTLADCGPVVPGISLKRFLKHFDQDNKLWNEIHLIWRTSVRCVEHIYHGALPDGGATQRINISPLPQHDYKYYE